MITSFSHNLRYFKCYLCDFLPILQGRPNFTAPPCPEVSPVSSPDDAFFSAWSSHCNMSWMLGGEKVGEKARGGHWCYQEHFLSGPDDQSVPGENKVPWYRKIRKDALTDRNYNCMLVKKGFVNFYIHAKPKTKNESFEEIVWKKNGIQIIVIQNSDSLLWEYCQFF